MTRQRRNPPPAPETGRARTRSRRVADQARRRIDASPEIELSDEELDALADEGIDADDLRRIARQHAADADKPVSPHDRDTARDDLEGLAFEDED